MSAAMLGPQLLPSAEPNADVITACEDLLAEARAGELRGIAWVGDKRGRTDSGWAFGNADRITILGALHLLALRIATEIVESSASPKTLP
jgi:hypothetical protein